ncbi:MAG TPA: hypothetical protein VHB69_00670 [Mycobacteriales bacterium]|nr:hypothetical protein [Mycobacteriales bacterium]
MTPATGSWGGATAVQGLHAWLEPGRFFGVFPVAVDQALAFFQAPRGEFAAFRADPMTSYRAELSARPGLAELIGDGEPVERLRGLSELPTFFRTSPGPGWALIGDAGHHKDPVVARGMADAFRDADVLSAAILAGWDGDLDAAVASYPVERDKCSRPLSEANLDVARLEGPADSLGRRWLELGALERRLDEALAA